MSQVIFTIDQKDYPIGCPDSQKERLGKLAKFIAKKESEVVDIMGANISHEMLLVMIIVSLSDELDRTKSASPETPKIDTKPLQEDIHEMIRFVKIMKDSLV